MLPHRSNTASGRAVVAHGEVGRAAASFLRDIIALTPQEIDRLREQSAGSDVLAIAAATLPREARALETIDLSRALRIMAPTLLRLGSTSAAWARSITHQLESLIPHARVVERAGHGHEAIDRAPDLVLSELLDFFGPTTLPQ